MTRHVLRRGIFVALLTLAGAGFAQNPSLEAALLQSYFVSVDNFAAPVMMGGMGIPFEPPMEMMGMMAERAGLPMEQMPRNPGMLAEAATERYLALFSNVILGVATHTDVPSPGRMGIFVEAFSFDTASGAWQVDSGRYSTAGSQYVANEMIWLEGTINGRLDGYPTIP